MMPKHGALFAGMVALVAIACGGSVASTESNGGTSSSSGGSTTSSSSGGGGSSSGGSCTSAPLKGNRACVPGIAPSRSPLVVSVDATDGCLGCFTTIDPCKVTVSGNTVRLSMSATTCTPSGDVGCPAVCMIPSAKCTIPGLPAGTYTVEVSGEGVRTSPSPRTLVVEDGTFEPTCELTQPGLPPPPLDPKKYSTSCSTDDDCLPARMGDPCRVCACPDTAIAKTDVLKHAADLRAASSQCATTGSEALCAACAPVKGACEIDPSALTGTCKLVPAQP